MKRALLLVDIQNDFLPGGTLAVAEGDAVVPIVNRLLPAFEHVVASQDWHPVEHLSFAAQHPGRQPFETIELDGLEQILWPTHCVQNSAGASFASALDVAAIDFVVRKGSDPRIDSYSAFYDNDYKRATGLADHLRAQRIDALFVAGLAADVCVQYTVLDALAEGFATTLITDATRGVDMRPGDTQAAVEAMASAGAALVGSDSIG